MQAKPVTALALIMLLAACNQAKPDASAPAGPGADLILTGGSVLTMEGDTPTYAEAVVVDDGKITFVGSAAEALKQKAADTVVKDISGKVLLPGFIDGHSHFMSALDMADQANISAPPAGPAEDPAAIIAELKKFAAARQLNPGDLIMGYGYDENLMPKEPLSRDILDAAFPDNPVIVIHVSMHGAVLNSKAFAKYGISAATPTPPGGIIQRKSGSQEPSGLLMETAAFPVLIASKGTPTAEDQARRLKFAQGLYAAAGITTAQEGATLTNDLSILKRAADKGDLFIDVVSFPYFLELDKTLAAFPAASWGNSANRLKIAGCKVTIDGSPQGRTAAFTSPYLNGGPNDEKNWKGEPGIGQADLNALVKKCYGLGVQMNMHANGDAAIDMALKAHEAAGGDLAQDRRTIITHAQFVRRDQLDRFKAYKFIPALFTAHSFFFGDTHIANRGMEQAAFLSPLRTASELGLKPTNHTDFNVVPIDQLLLSWTAVNRLTRTNVVLGPDERVTPYQALQAITINGAHQYGEEDSKGSIKPGKRADLVILSADPTKVDPKAIKDIKVVETIKDGKTIWPAS
jgi:predicted amidohydrolase YtcJ